MLREGRLMYRERVSPQNIGPFRVHDASMEGALLDLQSRLARTLAPVTVAGCETTKRWPKLELELELQIQIQFPTPSNGNRPHLLHLPSSASNNSSRRDSTPDCLRRWHRLNNIHLYSQELELMPKFPRLYHRNVLGPSLQRYFKEDSETT